MDFVNDADDIKNSFQQYYQATILNEEIDPNQLYKLKSILDDMQVYQHQEVEHFADVYYKSEAISIVGKRSSISCVCMCFSKFILFLPMLFS